MRKLKLLFAVATIIFGGMTASAQDAETYYIQNVSNGKWLGPGNDWGTQASVLNHADYWKLALNGGKYTLESVVSNGGTSYFLTGTYCDGGATDFTLTAVDGKENTYTIANVDGGLLTTNGTTVDVSGADATATASQWKLWSESDMAAGMAAATVESPFDATYLIKDHDLGRNNRDYSAWSNTGATAPKSSAGGSPSTVYSIEAFQKAFDVNQTLSNVPNGVYAVRVNGFYRQDGSNTNLPYVYANDSKTTLPVRTGTENNMQDAAVSFVAGKYLSEPAYVQVTDNTLKIGVATEGTSCWSIFKNFHLTYYGDCTVAEVILADYVKAYNDALTEAQGYITQGMFDEDANTLNKAINDNTLDLSNVTQEQLETATANLQAANAIAKVAAGKYATYMTAKELIEGKTNVDLTSVVTNPSFEEGNLNGWTSVDGGAPANNSNWSKVGTWYVERWAWYSDTQTHLSDGTLTHDALVLPAGLYTITAKAQNQEQKNGKAGTGYFLYANDEKVEITGTNTYSTSVLLSTDKSELVIKFALEGCTGNWISCDDIHLTYVGSDFPAYTLVTGKMNAEVAAAQTAADEAFRGSRTVANYNALTAAITAAQASKDAYAAAATAIANANALKEAHNLASATAYTTFAEAIAALETKYNDNTMTTDEGNGAGLSLGTVVTGWRAGANSAAVAYLNDGFSLNAFDAALYINTWSAEGENDGSNFKVPFYEYFAGDGSALGENTWTGQVTGLENGLYSVSAWVRVRSMNDATAVADLTGISMNVNGGTAVDVTEGDQVGESRFQLKEYTAEGLVKDGVLKVNFDIASENNIHWLSFKNIKYTKVRELTDEEMAVAPTAIALYNGETEVTEPIALDATTNTVTLTPSYTPAEASEGYIDWTSSDVSVATVSSLGEVTAVLPGTAIITATSTLDPSVSANVTVTVTYPESTVPATTYINDGATRTVLTLGENLIENGSFEYPNAYAYYGWKNGAGGDLAADNFDIVTDGEAKYVRSKNHNGATGAGSISTAWKIEEGKTYVFGYKAKSVNAGTTEFHVVSLTNTLNTETAKISTNQTVGTDWTEIKYQFTNTEGYQYLQFRARWLGEKGQLSSFDDFYLCEANSTIEGNVDYATAAIPTANIGTDAFQYSQDAIAAANALVQGTATVEDVEAAYEALTTLNVPEASQAYNLVFNCEGHSATGNALTLIPNPSQTQGLYGLKYLAPANKNLAQAFYFTHTTGNKYKVYAIDTDGNERYITTQAEGYGTTWYEGIRTIDDATKAMEIEIRPNGEGLYLLWNIGANKPLAHNGNNNNDLFTNNTANFQFVETTKPSIIINTTAAGWGTTILPFAASIPTDVKVYSCAEVDGNKLTLVEETAFEANKPYIIEGSWDETLTGDALGTKLEYTEGLLTGVYTQRDATVDTYVMQKLNDKVGFYKVTEVEGKVPTIKANRCYMTAPAAAGEARAAYFFTDDVTTGINAVEALTSGDAQIFNAAGAQLPKLQKGMNIIRKADGTSYKVMVK